MAKIAIDFGTTNTVIAVWRENRSEAETIHLPNISAPERDHSPSLIPSVIYIADGRNDQVVTGHAVYAGGYDKRTDDRYFSSFKRGIAGSPSPIPRNVDGVAWTDSRAGAAFMRSILAAVTSQLSDPIDEVVATVPVQSFERYLKWLRDDVFKDGDTLTGSARVRVVDESTSAALGYNVRTPGDLILVFDFGGGTLDVSLVRLPLAGDGTGVVFEDRRSVDDAQIRAADPSARVIAKAGRVLGGDDIDHWLLDELLLRNKVSRAEVGATYSPLKSAVEQAKISLSTIESADISVTDPDSGRTYKSTFSRSQFEEILDNHEFYGSIHKTLDKVIRSARSHGIHPEDINAVLMIGGSSLIPSVRRTVKTLFSPDRVYDKLPFEAVAHGAAYLSAGLGVDDFIYHSYGVRHLSPITGRHEWEEIIPSGVRYPMPDAVKLVLTASRDGQTAVELIIGEVEESSGGLTEVMFGDRAILLVEGGLELRRVVPLNDSDGARTVASLDPPGKAGEDRVEVEFVVDENRMRLVTVTDIITKRILLTRAPVIELK